MTYLEHLKIRQDLIKIAYDAFQRGFPLKSKGPYDPAFAQQAKPKK